MYFLYPFCTIAIEMWLKNLSGKNTNASLYKNSMGIADRKSCGNLGGIQFQHICQLTQILYSYPSEKKKSQQCFNYFSVFCLTFISHPTPVPVQSSFHLPNCLSSSISFAKDMSARQMCWHRMMRLLDVVVVVVVAGGEWRGPQRNLDVHLHSRDTGGGCTS